MKTGLYLLIGMLSTGCVIAEPASVKFTVRVLDEETLLPITNAIVQRYFEHQYDPWGAKPNIVSRQKEPVDQNGEVTLEGKTIKGGVGGSVFAEGYYSTSEGGSSKSKNLILNRWEPWNPTIEAKLRKIKSPVPMVHYQHKSNWMKMPEKDKSIGFDLEKGDWITPYGKGKVSDFIFHPYRIDTDEEIRFGYKLTFSNPLDGIQEYTPPENLRSSYVFPYFAPTNGYVSSMEKIKVDPFRGRVETDMNKQNHYIFRVRSHEDENGNIVGSYGRIKGEIMMSGQFGLQFGYWFNPVPNERSLEYSGENLLKKK